MRKVHHKNENTPKHCSFIRSIRLQCAHIDNRLEKPTFRYDEMPYRNPNVLLINHLIKFAKEINYFL